MAGIAPRPSVSSDVFSRCESDKLLLLLFSSTSAADEMPTFGMVRLSSLRVNLTGMVFFAKLRIVITYHNKLDTYTGSATGSSVCSPIKEGGVYSFALILVSQPPDRRVMR